MYFFIVFFTDPHLDFHFTWKNGSVLRYLESLQPDGVFCYTLLYIYLTKKGGEAGVVFSLTHYAGINNSGMNSKCIKIRRPVSSSEDVVVLGK
jgi:hypothetical protein